MARGCRGSDRRRIPVRSELQAIRRVSAFDRVDRLEHGHVHHGKHAGVIRRGQPLACGVVVGAGVPVDQLAPFELGEPLARLLTEHVPEQTTLQPAPFAASRTAGLGLP